jgi:glyoxylase-like metal-dependent hydrolase (beta-lactamase superfamily II)
MAVFFLPNTVRAARDFSKVKIRSVHVAGNVHMLEGTVGNMGVSVGEDGLLLIDDDFAPLAGKIQAALKNLGKGPLKFVLNTHWHGDHTGGNHIFGRKAPIISHTNVRKRLTQTIKWGKRVFKPKPKEALPVVTFDESLSIHFNGEEIKVIHYPTGHTDGDSVIFFTKSNVVHMGDQMFSGMFPFVDLSTGGDVEGYTKNVAAVLAKIPSDVKIIPGHGPLSGVKELKTLHEMLTGTTAIVRKQIQTGKILAQIKAKGLPAKWKSWAWRFVSEDRWIATIYNSLTKKK